MVPGIMANKFKRVYPHDRTGRSLSRQFATMKGQLTHVAQRSLQGETTVCQMFAFAENQVAQSFSALRSETNQIFAWIRSAIRENEIEQNALALKVNSLQTTLEELGSAVGGIQLWDEHRKTRLSNQGATQGPGSDHVVAPPSVSPPTTSQDTSCDEAIAKALQSEDDGGNQSREVPLQQAGIPSEITRFISGLSPGPKTESDIADLKFMTGASSIVLWKGTNERCGFAYFESVDAARVADNLKLSSHRLFRRLVIKQKKDKDGRAPRNHPAATTPQRSLSTQARASQLPQVRERDSMQIDGTHTKSGNIDSGATQTQKSATERSCLRGATNQPSRTKAVSFEGGSPPEGTQVSRNSTLDPETARLIEKSYTLVDGKLIPSTKNLTEKTGFKAINVPGNGKDCQPKAFWNSMHRQHLSTIASYEDFVKQTIEKVRTAKKNSSLCEFVKAHVGSLPYSWKDHVISVCKGLRHGDEVSLAVLAFVGGVGIRVWDVIEGEFLKTFYGGPKQIDLGYLKDRVYSRYDQNYKVVGPPSEGHYWDLTLQSSSSSQQQTNSRRPGGLRP